METRGTSRKVRKDEQIPTSKVQTWMRRSQEQTGETRAPHAVTAALLEQKMRWDISHMVGALWWMDTSSSGKTGKEDRKTRGALHMKEQLEHLWWMPVWLRVWVRIKKEATKSDKDVAVYYRPAHEGGEDSQALEQVTQGGCAVSILGDCQVLTWKIKRKPWGMWSNVTANSTWGVWTRSKGLSEPEISKV